MKIHYREPTVLEQMNNAIRVSNEANKKPIEYFELSGEELNSYYSNFDKTADKDNRISYSYKGIAIKVNK
jgi:cytochrome c peroxidase